MTIGRSSPSIAASHDPGSDGRLRHQSRTGRSVQVLQLQEPCHHRGRVTLRRWPPTGPSVRVPPRLGTEDGPSPPASPRTSRSRVTSGRTKAPPPSGRSQGWGRFAVQRRRASRSARSSSRALLRGPLRVVRGVAAGTDVRELGRVRHRLGGSARARGCPRPRGRPGWRGRGSSTPPAR